MRHLGGFALAAVGGAPTPPFIVPDFLLLVLIVVVVMIAVICPSVGGSGVAVSELMGASHLWRILKFKILLV